MITMILSCRLREFDRCPQTEIAGQGASPLPQGDDRDHRGLPPNKPAEKVPGAMASYRKTIASSGTTTTRITNASKMPSAISHMIKLPLGTSYSEGHL